MYILYRLDYQDEYYYYGITNNLKRRLYEHSKKKNQFKLQKVSVIKEFCNENDAYEYEKCFVNELLLDDSKCLNRTKGGRHPYPVGPRKPHSTCTKGKISNSKKGKSPNFSNEYRKKLAERMRYDNPSKRPEIREKISLKLKLNNPRRGKPGTMLGKKFTPEQKSKISYKIQTPNGIFLSSVDAGNHYNVSQQTIVNRCKSKSERWNGWQILAKGQKFGSAEG